MTKFKTGIKKLFVSLHSKFSEICPMGKTGPAVTSALYELILKRELFPLNFSDGFIFFVCLKIQ